MKVTSVYFVINSIFYYRINAEFSQGQFVLEGILRFSCYEGEHFNPQVAFPWLNQLPFCSCGVRGVLVIYVCLKVLVGQTPWQTEWRG
jgi:hypothetical protein